MSEVRWQRGVAPPLMVMGLVVGMFWAPAAAVAATAAAPTIAPAACATGDYGRPGGWYRRVSHADGRGWLRGYTLLAGRPDGTRTARIRLPAESFAAVPVKGLLVYGSDDGAASEVRVVRLADGCDARLVRSRDVIRRATLDPSGSMVYVHRVDRRTRADLGIWRYAIAGAMDPVRVMPHLPDPAAGPFGRTFLTLFTWSGSGRTLAVQSCGEVECRTRLLDTRTGAWTLDDRHGQGELVALSDTERYGYAACHVLPCRIEAIGTGGSRRTLAASAGIAAFASGRLWYERSTGGGPVTLRSLDPASRPSERVHRATGRIAWPARWADAAVELPGEWLALTEDGTWTDPAQVTLARFGTGDTFRLRVLEEVTP